MIFKFILACLTLAVLLTSTVSALQCYECFPSPQNNFCRDLDSKNVPKLAQQVNCNNGYCLKSTGDMEMGTKVREPFVLNMCVDRASSNALELNTDGQCHSGDKAENLFMYYFRQAQQSRFSLNGDVDGVTLCRCDQNFCNGAASIKTTAFISSLALAFGAVLLSKLF